MKLIRFLTYSFVVGILILLGNNNVNAAGVVTYDYNNTSYGNRTMADVAQEYSKAINAGETYVSNDESTYYTVPASIEAPYNQGTLTNDTLKSMQAMTDFYRYLIGARPLQKKCVQNESLQYQALDRNFQFSHSISNSSKPEDMSDELWQKGYKLDHNILARYSTPTDAITSWVNEGYITYSNTWDTTGHRTALISPINSSVQFGYCGDIAIGKICERNNTGYDEPFYAFPAAGFMPKNVVYPGYCVWSTYLNTEYVKVEDSSSVVITVTNTRTGESYKCKSEDSTATIGTSTINFVQPSDNEEDRYTDTYSVTIKGLVDVSSGNPAVIKYDVKFFDVNEYANSYVKSVKAEGFSKLVIYKSMNDKENMKKIAAVLPNKVTVVADSGYKTSVSVKGAWKWDENNQCYINKADASELPKHISDKLGKLENIKISYEISDDYYDQYNSIGTVGTVAEGNTIQMYVYRTMMTSHHSKIFKINPIEDGYVGEEIFDRYTSSEYDAEASAATSYPYDYYNFGPLKVSDSGEYISIYYSDDEYYDEAYVSVSTKKISINHRDAFDVIDIPGTKHKHTEKIINVKKATIFESGYTGDIFCSSCGKIIKKGEVLKKLSLSKPKVKCVKRKTRIKIKWTKVINATCYEIRYKKGKKWKKKIVRKTNYTIKKIKKYKKIKIKIRAIAVNNKSKVCSSTVKKTLRIK